MAIGPSAGSCCYEVDEPVLAKVREALADWAAVVRRRTGPDRALIDLRELVRRQARLNGVMNHNIAVVNTCTICHPERFYSYRRDGVVKETMLSGIALIPRR
jgi:copper oxidase (laccase) domain-containing protein